MGFRLEPLIVSDSKKNAMMQEKFRPFIILSVLISFILHLFIYTLAARLDLTASFFSRNKDESPTPQTIITFSQDKAFTPEQIQKAEEMLKLLSPKLPDFPTDTNHSPSTNGPLSNPDIEAIELDAAPSLDETATSNLPPTLPSISIPVIKIENTDTPSLTNLNHIARTPLAPQEYILPHTDNVTPAPSSATSGGLGLKRPSLPSISLRNKLHPLSNNIQLPTPKLNLTSPELKRPQTKAKILDSLLEIDTASFDHGNDRYFRVDIRTKDLSSRLKTLPKDILFLIDTSGSISRKKLKHFTSAIRREINKLSTTDRFNIVQFKAQPYPCFNNFQHPTTANISKATSFTNRFINVGSTNIYNAFESFIPKETPSRPLIIFLMTDGKITTGELKENAPLIQAITSLNQGRATICSFGTGDDTNKFMLNFLSYRNRGYTKLEKNVEHTSATLSQFIQRTSNALVVNLKYYFNQEIEVYPQNLPHLYSGKTLSLYGKLPKGQNEVILRISGQSTKKTPEELLLKIDLSKSSKGSKLISHNWAAQKIYHLIGLSTEKPDNSLNATARQLSEQFGIDLPFTPVTDND